MQPVPNCSLIVRTMTKLLLAVFLLLTNAALGRDVGPGEALELRKKNALVPLEQILATVSERYPESRLLEIELEEEHGFFLYEVEILTNHRQIRELEIDARTGAIIKDERED